MMPTITLREVLPEDLPDAIRRALALFRASPATRIFLDNPGPDP